MVHSELIVFNIYSYSLADKMICELPFYYILDIIKSYFSRILMLFWKICIKIFIELKWL